MWLYRFNKQLYPLGWVYWRLGLEGAKDAIPRQGPLILAPNHSSFFDPWFIGMAFPRPVRYLINHQWYYRSRAWQGLFRSFGTVPVKQRDPRGTIEVVCEHLGQGQVFGIFPEGKISGDGRVGKLQTGLARMAAMSAAPVMPVGVRGAFESLPRHRRVPRPSRVRVWLGEPIHFPGAPLDRPDKEAIDAFNARLLTDILRLSGRNPGVLARAEAPSS